MTKLKCYFAHPFNTRGSEEEKKIISILEERRIEVINPFDGEDRYLALFGVKEYWQDPLYNIGRDLWKKDLKQIEDCDMLVAYLPEGSIGTAAEIQFALDCQKKKRRNRANDPYLIQIITDIRHPLVAFAMAQGNQHFETIGDFKILRKCRWD